MAVLIADWLEGRPWHALPPTALLRLVSVLCYDVAQGYTLRADINQRLQVGRMAAVWVVGRGGVGVGGVGGVGWGGVGWGGVG